MVVGSLSTGIQVVIIGSGPGGYVAAIRLAQLKKEVLLIEKDVTLGGVCLNEGCIPSKALIHVADFFSSAKKMEMMGLRIDGMTLDVPKLQEWKSSIVAKLTSGVKLLCEKNGVQIMRGNARFDGISKLIVQGENGLSEIEFENAVIATGSIPTPIPTLPLDGENIVGSREALNFHEIPKRVVVVGGGYIGLELGGVYRKFGSEVTIIEAEDALLKSMEPDVVAVLTKRLNDLGIKILMKTKALKADGIKPVVLTLECDGKPFKVEADRVLVAVGRKPNTQNLNLESAGIEVNEKRFIKTGKDLRTTNPKVFAIGDVAGGPLLAHKAFKEAKVAADAIAGGRAEFDNIVIPAVIFTDPEIAWAGLNEREAKEKGYDIVTGKFPFRASGRALSLGDTDGFVKTIADAKTKQILGIHIVGSEASELISEAAIAIEMRAFLDDIADMIIPHPTLSEAIAESAEAALGFAIHTINPKNAIA